jgi:hypothetical protein
MTSEGLIGQGVGIRLITWERAINGFPRPVRGGSGRRLYSFQVKNVSGFLSLSLYLSFPIHLECADA